MEQGSEELFKLQVFTTELRKRRGPGPGTLLLISGAP
jgi:hypothetical protein